MLEYFIAAFSNVFYGVRSDEEGQTAVEYTLVLLLVALVLVAAVALGMTGALGDALNKISASLRK